MIRLIGADSGPMMVTTRWADTILPNPILISLMSISYSLPLLNILDLFPDLFNLTLHFNDSLGHRRITAFGGNGVGFTIKFLYQEVHTPTDRMIFLEHLAELLDMTVETDHLLCRVHLIRIKSNFLDET